ncbi:nuclear transport factor 2 family protein [Actinoplanes sp. NPDC023936]|uniref:nuclear transport factor 2 family protein n=1 Tax=Actinoplanes sp. NPDC023936 TaxID=3154910 RepID=UPI0033F79D21
MSDTLVSQQRPAAQHALAEHLRLVSSGRIDEWVALFAPDATLEFPYAPTGVPSQVQGHAALVAHMNNFPKTFDVQFVDLVFHETADPATAIAEFRSTGRAVPTGKPYEQTCISVVHTDEAGRITRYVDYWNPLVAIEALNPGTAEAGADQVAFGS